MSDDRVNEADKADEAARRRLREKAESYYLELEDGWNEALPGNQSPAEIVFIAHLFTAIDGFNDVKWLTDWTRRPRSGWQTSVCYLPELKGGLRATSPSDAAMTTMPGSLPSSSTHTAQANAFP